MVELPDPQQLAPAPDLSWSGAGPEHRFARLHPDLVLLEVVCTAASPPGAAVLLVEGRALPPPTAALLLGGGAEASAPRLLFAARDRDGRVRPGAACELRRGDRPVAGFAIPRAEAPAPMLLGERDAAEREALLRFLVSTCAPLLRTRALPGFAAACHALGRALAAGGATAARPLCRPGASLSLWRVPGAPSGGAWYLLERGGLRRVTAPQNGVLVLDGAAPSADALLLPPAGGTPPLGFAAVPATAPPLRDHLARLLAVGGERPSRTIEALARHSATDARCAALLREIQLLAPARPHRVTDPVAPVGGAIELALADGAGGLFLCGWLRDPLGLVAGMELRSGLARRPVPAEAVHRVARPDLAEAFAGTAFGGGGPLPGFLAHLPEADHPAVAQWRLALRLASGEALTLTAPPARLRPAAARDLVLRAAHPSALRPGLLEDCIAPAAARLHRAAMQAGRNAAPEVVRIGAAPPRRPRGAIVVPLYRNLRFLRFQLAAFARDAATRAAELVYVLDSPEQRGEVEHLLRGMAALHDGLAVTLAVMPENRGYASACNAGATLATAPVLAMLNSDVLPAAPGWLEALLRRLARDRRLAAVGPKLLFDDGSIQHAGLLFRHGADGRWLNDHYFKGFPRHHAPACVPRRVPGVTGAALVVRRPAFEAAGGFCTDYIVGDFEDSDLCLALRAAGGEIGYEPAAELFHFERQSIADHAGHARTLAGACNRLLHHRRWDGAIAALMRRFPEED